jgi:sarcosine oxidase
MALGSYDVIVVGLGSMGSAALYHLARLGVKASGFDLHTPPHMLGSHHGESRIIREAYYEHPSYVPLVQRAYHLWRELELAGQQKLLIETGGVMVGPPQGELVAGARLSAEIHGLQYEILSPDELSYRYPAFKPSEDVVALWEPRAGVLLPEKCVETHLKLAKELGAEIHGNEPVTSWAVEGEGVTVTTSVGPYKAQRLIITAGAWISALVDALAQRLWVERQVLFWFEPTEPELFSPGRFPIFAWELEGKHLFFGLPDLGSGFKVARHHDGQPADPQSLDRNVYPHEIADIRSLLARHIPKANGRLVNSAVCMYTNTPDFHFVLDLHPDHPQVVLISACSGHGFKFSSAIGELAAHLATDGKTDFDLSPFRVNRLLV